MFDIKEVVNIGSFGRGADPQRLSFCGDLESLAPPSLFLSDALPERIISEHSGKCLVPGAAFYAIPGHELGGFGLIQRNGKIFVDNTIQPEGLNQIITSGNMPDVWKGSLLNSDAQIIECEEPIGVVLNPHLVWGHFLSEMLPRIWLFSKLASFGIKFKVAVPTDAPSWVQEFIFLFFSKSDCVFYDGNSQRLKAPFFILPSMLNIHYHFHPIFNLAIEEIHRKCGATDSKSENILYLSRRFQKSWRVFDNELEIEDEMQKIGARIIYPEQISLRDQIKLYASSKLLIANYSSASHNALFAPVESSVCCIGWMNRCQSGISCLRNQFTSFFPIAENNWEIEGQADKNQNYAADPLKFRDHVLKFLDSN